MKNVRMIACVSLTAALLTIGMGVAGAASRQPDAAAVAVASAAVRPAGLGLAPSYIFQTIDNTKDPTFNQLLGINDSNVIAGYFGSGTPPTTHPNKGYVVTWPYTQADFTNENFPGSQQTQVTGINDGADTVGFWVNANGDQFGFTHINGKFKSISNPHTPKSKPGTPAVVDQLLGINTHRVAVGFYTDAAGHNHGYTYDVASKSFKAVGPPNSTSVTATGINSKGDVSGFFTHSGDDGSGATASFIDSGGKYTVFEAPGSSNTTAFGINDDDDVVGSYFDANQVMHGFIYRDGYIQTVDNPDAASGSTVINGVNNHLQLVGFSVDATGNTHGFEANPNRLHSFKTLDDTKDLTFNQLLGINDHNIIAGYFGSGTPPDKHPNKGYVLKPPYAQVNYTDENFPGSMQTQVTGLNNGNVTVGFYADATGNNFGFTDVGGTFTKVVDPNTPPMTTRLAATNQLLGVNDHNIAVGFYLDVDGNAHGYTYDLKSHSFHAVTPPNATSVTATGINDAGNVSGFFTEANGDTASFLTYGHGKFAVVQFPGSTNTTALGVNIRDQLVGSYVDAAGLTHGFLYTNGTFQSIDDPNGVGTTVVNGINSASDLVGFYVDSQGNTDGFLSLPE